MNQSGLNLARAWRSKTLNEIIGQDIVVRLLKNSLFKGQFFPVYLLSGQRGCGKTSTARIFAAALNCEKLSEFQKTPQGIGLPCLLCVSCTAMQKQAHPDFIEIDAASHTGVDNVRALIEAASFLPVMGNKKIYLIDEAHMLSKAAFNAFLKILEEPPTSVLFLLATTDPEKIIDTVVSRCFKLFFDPIAPAVLTKHLMMICAHENIGYEEKGIELIVHESSGSARDALNMIERVRLLSGVIDAKMVKSVLKLCDDQQILTLFAIICTGNVVEFLTFCKEQALFQQSALLIWKKVISVLQALLQSKHGIKLDSFTYYEDHIKKMAAHCSVDLLIAWLELCYIWELQLQKTVVHHALLELLFLKMIEMRTKKGERMEKEIVSLPKVHNEEVSIQKDVSHNAPQAQSVSNWERFLTQVKTLEDPLLNSIFVQGIFKGNHEGKIVVVFSKEFSFFKDLLVDTKKLWQPLLNATFGGEIESDFQFIEGIAAPLKKIEIQEVTQLPNAQKSEKKEAVVPNKFNNAVPNTKNYYTKQKETAQLVSVSDLKQYPKAQMLLKIFPGVLSEVKEPEHDT
ncbi:MAG: DNA polymerase III subunit gamma/tau [Candidatus Babeliaceae bacterium]